ncbi:hypothetical protein BLEM_2289 [Bifidobacterium lemurum]|uniref:Uncharacterized protein n=1 Tax=Bifidobacterium lemurum TaxID=1603886 RepID=A0A261FJB5_9BIFI|nr:hypothetical protein [Bifidobacterium lemurum]OZG59254.1 hypothetical protein BLEM_2289 [Bifidobacterium lemurum]QOL33902.1 hypothetical protein BL8807_09050 [Bifidobacterium lemurum]
MLAELTCTPTVVDERDRAVDGCGLEFALRLTVRQDDDGWMEVSDGDGATCADLAFDPPALRELAGFLARHAALADEYLRRYGRADEDPELQEIGQFHFETHLATRLEPYFGTYVPSRLGPPLDE